jgi:hypothetical protein
LETDVDLSGKAYTRLGSLFDLSKKSPLSTLALRRGDCGETRLWPKPYSEYLERLCQVLGNLWRSCGESAFPQNLPATGNTFHQRDHITGQDSPSRVRMHCSGEQTSRSRQ